MIKLRRLKLGWAKLAFWLILLAGLFFYLNSSAPFMAIASDSMTPTLSRGDLIFTQSVPPDIIKEGDIIVYRVPTVFQEKYGYPSTICHRVVRVQKSEGTLAFRTKGDSAGEDPFMVLPQDVVGKESQSIPYLGYLVMFPQSQQGWLFFLGLVILYLIYKYADSLIKGARKMRGSFFGISTAEFASSQQNLEQKMVIMTGQITQSMDAFAAAMSEYAKHLASHTSAVESLAQAAKHLETVLAKQEELMGKNSAVTEARRNTRKKEMPLAPKEVTPELRQTVTTFVKSYINKQCNEQPDDILPDNIGAASFSKIMQIKKSLNAKKDNKTLK